LSLGVPVKWLGNKKVFAEDALNDLKMLIGVICLAVGLLSLHLVSKDSTRWLVGALNAQLSIEHVCCAIAVIKPLFFFFGALFKEYFPQHILFLFVGVIVADIIIVWLVEDRI